MAGATPREKAILAAIENKLGPVGKGHHESHRSTHILEWLRAHPKKEYKPGTRRPAS